MGWLDKLFVDKNFKKIYAKQLSDFRRDRPDVCVFVEVNYEPCEYILWYVDCEGKKYGEFYQSAGLSRDRYKTLQKKYEEGEVKHLVRTVAPSYGALEFPRF